MDITYKIQLHILHYVRYEKPLSQFRPPNAHSFIKITTTLQHTSCYMFRHSLVHRQGVHNCNKQFLNPLTTELNPNCKSQLTEFFCGLFKFCAWYSKNLNISRTKWDKFLKQKAFCGEGNRHCSEIIKNAVIFLLRNGKDKFLNELVNIHAILLTLRSRLQLFVRRTDE